jgi:hypothetical protein
LSIRDRAKAIGISYLLWDKVPFYLIQEVVWNYRAPVAGSKFFSPRNEKFLWYVKNQYKFTFNLDEGLFWICCINGSVSVSLTQAFRPVPREALFLRSPKTRENRIGS